MTQEGEKPADKDDTETIMKRIKNLRNQRALVLLEEDLQGWTGIDQAEVDANYDDELLMLLLFHVLMNKLLMANTH